MKTPIIQFGTSRFLQAHADLFISDAMREGQGLGPVTVVQTTGSADRAGRLAAFDGRPLPIVVRGLEKGVPVERTEYTTCLVRGLSAAGAWAEVERVFIEADQVISNTGDSGYQMPPGEILGDDIPVSFPAKLTRLLAARWRADGGPLTLFPTELVTDNGTVLAGLCEGVARRSGLPDTFVDWMRGDCVWANSLVDRIVSDALEPAGAVTEPYALWAIETQDGLHIPLTHPAIKPVDDLTVTARLKLFILNLGHSCLAERWLADRRPAEENVRAMLSDPAIRAWLDTIYDTEILPVFAAAGIAEAPDYRAGVMQRFLNPFLDHRMADIAMNHAAKKARRIGGLLDMANESAPGHPAPTLIAIRDSGLEGFR
ncbi:MAG: mannitol dehydrogenase family protein [Bauldia sp.]|uniref:mannitol dehydrogenase family protein n=1 Tax=Bauldia sp. TaxID=2575872 RepID=UPI001D88E363|nr:mannitol dehydrogenase family protein [Bauldia sp.]MCB1496426.1 mannitol dehydrogenase family protein [Bauldia sp.]